jgi:hypothetical protein
MDLLSVLANPYQVCVVDFHKTMRGLKPGCGATGWHVDSDPLEVEVSSGLVGAWAKVTTNIHARLQHLRVSGMHSITTSVDLEGYHSASP